MFQILKPIFRLERHSWFPPLLLVATLGDIDDGSYSLHRFILDKLVPRFPKGYLYPSLAYNLYLDSGGADADEKGVLKSAATAKELGFETFVVDAMWFPQSGDWRWDPKRFPNGHKPIEEYVHSHDMQLGLWMAYTQGSNSSDPHALNIAEHPDWFNTPPKLDPAGHINWDAPSIWGVIRLVTGPSKPRNEPFRNTRSIFLRRTTTPSLRNASKPLTAITMEWMLATGLRSATTRSRKH